MRCATEKVERGAAVPYATGSRGVRMRDGIGRGEQNGNHGCVLWPCQMQKGEWKMTRAEANALAPLGVRDLDMPATSDRVWHAIQQAKTT